MNDREERQRRDQDAIMIEAAVVQGLRDEIEQLRGAKNALQAEIDRLRKLNDEQQAEMLSWHMQLGAKNEEIKQLKVQWEAAKRKAEKMLYDSGFMLGEAHTEIRQLKLDRTAVKRAIEQLLEKYGQIAAEVPPVPHSGLGRGGLK